MRKILLSFFMTILTCLSASATDFYLWLMNTAGDEESWALSDVRKITFNGTDVVITTTDGSSKTFAMDEINKMNFHTQATAINDLKADASVQFDGSVLQVSAPSGTTVSVYTAIGSLASKTVVDGSGQVSLSDLPKGVYMIKIGNNLTKVLKR